MSDSMYNMYAYVVNRSSFVYIWDTSDDNKLNYKVKRQDIIYDCD